MAYHAGSASGIGPLFVVEQALAGGDFAPSGDAVASDFNQDDFALGGAAKLVSKKWTSGIRICRASRGRCASIFPMR
ncbi:MAG: hypothetical protein U0Q18_33935 [Bryobacteraceae bacterium]